MASSQAKASRRRSLINPDVKVKYDKNTEAGDGGDVTRSDKRRIGWASASRPKRRSKSKSKREEINSKPETLNDEVAKIKAANICAQRWNALFAARGSRKTPTNKYSSESNNNVDAFDCSDLVVPPTFDLVNCEIDRGVFRWTNLASRIIIEEDGPTTVGKADQEVSEIPLRNHELLLDATIRGDKRKQRLLPYNFDYSHGSNSVEDTCSVHHCPKVVSLLDPTETLDYKNELCHVFKSVKTSDKLDIQHALGTESSHGAEDGNITLGCQHTLAAKNGLQEWFAKYSRLDAHSLGRLRIRDRSAPAGGAAYPSSYTINNDVHNVKADQITNHDVTDDRTDSQTTIRFEILRHSQSLKRGSGSDAHRMEVELHGSLHTLLDLHHLLTECAVNTESSTKGRHDCPSGVFFIENNFFTCGEAGDEIVEAIQHWLDSKELESEEDKEPVPMEEQSVKVERPLPIYNGKLEATDARRRDFLGLSPFKKSIPMSKMNLEDMTFRLGVRYFHMFVPPPISLNMRPDNLGSLANESAVYVTGIHTHPQTLVAGRKSATQNDIGSNQQPYSRLNTPGRCAERNAKQSTRTRAPIIIHDTWAPPQRHYCLACNYSLASVVTVNSPLTDATPPGLGLDSDKVHPQGVPLCSACYEALHYQQSYRRGEDTGDQPLLKLRSHGPFLAFPLDDYERMVTSSSLDDDVYLPINGESNM